MKRTYLQKSLLRMRGTAFERGKLKYKKLKRKDPSDEILNQLSEEQYFLISKWDDLSGAIVNMTEALRQIRGGIDFLNGTTMKKYRDDNFIFDVSVKGIPLKFQDALLSFTVPSVANEMSREEYDFLDLNFSEGDCVIDIGGNVGMVSIYLAKKYPFLKIYAFEPVRRNYENFKKNIALNNIPDGVITLENKAVTKDGRTISMQFNAYNSGGSSVTDIVSCDTEYQHVDNGVESITLNEIFNKYNLKNVKLLKIDCEGSEYEILYNTDESKLNSIYALRGEFHEKKSVKELSEADELLAYIKKHVKNVKVAILREFI